MYPADRRWLFSANLSAQKLTEPVLTVADCSLQLGAPALETGPFVYSFCALIFPAPYPEQQPGLTGGPIADVALHDKLWRPDLRCFLKALKPRVMTHCCSLLTDFPRQSKPPLPERFCQVSVWMTGHCEGCKGPVPLPRSWMTQKA